MAKPCPPPQNSKCAAHLHVGIVKRQNPWFHPIPVNDPNIPKPVIWTLSITSITFPTLAQGTTADLNDRAQAPELCPSANRPTHSQSGMSDHFSIMIRFGHP
ncbi:hypothetical protein J7T55_002695 [Diaporthe amygdali]|uniref:uncharacterized protein n=1 Tax=Phomopsis amygdali TaxID=1214568 RepID=UPI0022FF400E|nr:uncharacterized protein J7T55_002695 [Diaporthe amygdali]KAJ0122183.1 hypothetical protein J7T55_002695 [Diaporthe amygdali]